jgi:predicted DNA-binding protein
MTGNHEHGPVCFRPSTADRKRLHQLAAVTGRAINDILKDALTAYLDDLDTQPREITR